MTQLRLYFLAFMISLMLTVLGCGQTGDLYLPEDDPKRKSKDQSTN